ncbi:MAG: DUF3089 domain-containing protein [Bacteroidales bacterium]|nr:DUF3089 domain-containing protein [Bacteroidales bacterium]
MKRYYLVLFVWLLIFGNFQVQAQNFGLTVKTDYSLACNWYQNHQTIDNEKVDVFYVLSTWQSDWTDSKGAVHHYAQVNSDWNKKETREYAFANAMFADSANFFAPYYQHMTLQCWAHQDSVDTYLPAAMDEVKRAFDYYMKHLNGGRKFILAGYSQGGCGVVNLLKHMDDAAFSRMIAAYVVGFKVSKEDLKQSKHFVAAKGEADQGVTVVFNSVTQPESINQVISGENQFCINPVSWSVDAKETTLSDTMTVALMPAYNVLKVKGIDEDKYFVPAVSYLFPKGNLHLKEMDLYRNVVNQNVKKRIKASKQ